MNNKKVISITKANLLGLLILPVISTLLIPFYYLWNFPDLSIYINKPINLLIFIVVIIISMIVHEMIHALCFAFYAKDNWKSVKIGILWKYLTPYAHCKEPLNISQYRIALLMPGLILGIIPTIIGLFFGYFFLLVFGIFLTVAAGGDIIIFLMTYSISTNKKLLDHPSECGFIIID